MFVSNRAGISAERLSNFMGVNRKTAQLLARKLPFLIVPGTNRENCYPVEFRADTIKSENKENVMSFFERHNKYNKRTVLNTDGDGAYNILNDKLNHKSQIIDYEDDEHQIYWIHKVISDIKSNILGIYRRISKPYLEGYVHE